MEKTILDVWQVQNCHHILPSATQMGQRLVEVSASALHLTPPPPPPEAGCVRHHCIAPSLGKKLQSSVDKASAECPDMYIPKIGF